MDFWYRQKCCGHNLLGHDLPALHTLQPDLALLRKPVIDTLYFSPLAFPENPYHRLVKDYKLVRDAVNDLVADERHDSVMFAERVSRGKAAEERRKMF